MLNPSQLFKSLSDDTRLKTVLLIAHEKELCVCELTEAIDESQPKVSRHLAQLKSQSVLKTRRQSQWVYYRLSEDLPTWAEEVIQTTLKAQKHTIEPYLKNLSAMMDRPNCCN